MRALRNRLCPRTNIPAHFRAKKSREAFVLIIFQKFFAASAFLKVGQYHDSAERRKVSAQQSQAVAGHLIKNYTQQQTVRVSHFNSP